MKKLKLTFAFMLFAITAIHAQDLKTSIDYQYKRTANSYTAYTLFFNKETSAVSLSLTATETIDDLQSVKVTYGKLLLDVPFKKSTIKLPNDDKSIHSLTIELDLGRIWQEKIDCETTLIFTMSNSSKFELPFKFCSVKEKIGI